MIDSAEVPQSREAVRDKKTSARVIAMAGGRMRRLGVAFNVLHV